MLLVSVGGIIGSVLRWQFIETLPTPAVGVFIVNQLGVFVAGMVTFRLKGSENQRLFWVTGFAGGYTTMSSLAFILHESTIINGFFYAFASFISSLIILVGLKIKEKV